VTTASLKTNHRKNECLGIAMGNHTVFHQGTTGCLLLSFSQVSAQEYLPFLESQTGRSSPPSWISGRLLCISTIASDLAEGQNQSSFLIIFDSLASMEKPES
jgi:hypothetical protein